MATRVCATGAPGRGRMALWPTNEAQTISLAGHTKLAHRTQFTGFLSYGVWTNASPLQPFTINAALPQLALPRTDSEARTHVTSMNLNLVSRPEQLQGKSGLQIMRAMLTGELPYPHIMQTLDFHLVQVDRGRAVFQGVPQLMHSAKAVQGSMAEQR